ncbi:MAG: recombination protein RecR, partial [Xanthomonadales bacterium]|nr:recombination protein RecR [Xanthomonadales bacterium]
MSTGSPLLADLIEALRCLPGVGAKTAQRMAFHMLERDRPGARRLAERLAVAVEKVGNCRRCRGFSEQEICSFCANASRDKHLLCVVETPVDQLAIEQATGYRGHYFVLLGRLSPLDGLGTSRRWRAGLRAGSPRAASPEPGAPGRCRAGDAAGRPR